MTKFIFSVLTAAALSLLVFLSPVKAQEQPPTPGICGTTAEDFINSAVTKNNAKIRVANAKAHGIIMEAINTERAKAKLWAYEADKLVIGLIQHQGKLYVGIAMFKDGCVVPGTVKMATAMEFISFITSYGLSMDDFEEMRGA
jgi:hypothetical protein